MSQPATSPAHNGRARHTSATSADKGLTLWTAMSITIAALFTGTVLATTTGSIGWLYLTCFAIAAIATTAAVRLSGLFLHVASLPILFAIGTVITSWLVAKENLAGNADPFSKTMLLSAAYPLALYFPYLAGITVLTIIIAVWRLHSAKRSYETQLQRLERQRKQAARMDRRNRETTTRVRQISRQPRRHDAKDTHRVPFQELVKDVDKRGERRRASREPSRPNARPRPIRSDEQTARRAKPASVPQKPARRSLDDDLYS